jgi:hypothetical protein
VSTTLEATLGAKNALIGRGDVAEHMRKKPEQSGKRRKTKGRCRPEEETREDEGEDDGGKITEKIENGRGGGRASTQVSNLSKNPNLSTESSGLKHQISQRTPTYQLKVLVSSIKSLKETQGNERKQHLL